MLFVYLLIVLFQLPEPVASCLSLTFKIPHAVLTADVSSVPFPLLCLLGCSWCMYLTVVIHHTVLRYCVFISFGDSLM